MAVVTRFRVGLLGWPGGPGVMTFHALAALELEPDEATIENFAFDLYQMLNDLKQFWANDVRAEMPLEARLFDADTGDLIKIVGLAPQMPITSSNAASATSRATMAKFQYVTDRITNNRVLRGGPFFGPLGDTALDPDGLLLGTFQQAVVSAHGGLLDIAGAMRLAVYGPPTEALPVGRWGYVQSAAAWAVPAVLRRRRD